MSSESLLSLAQLYSDVSGLKITTISTYASGSGDFFSRLSDGKDVTTRRAARVIQWFSDHWPADLAWPTDIPRPTPSPDSPVDQIKAGNVKLSALLPYHN